MKDRINNPIDKPSFPAAEAGVQIVLPLLLRRTAEAGVQIVSTEPFWEKGAATKEIVGHSGPGS
jgi:hypothetical protein